MMPKIETSGDDAAEVWSTLVNWEEDPAFKAKRRREVLKVFYTKERYQKASNVVVVWCYTGGDRPARWWWCYPTPSEGWGRGETPRRLNSQVTPQDLDQRSKMEEVVLKMAPWRGLDASRSRRRK